MELEEPIQATIVGAYERADVVVIGQVISDRSSYSKQQRIAVIRVWKGYVPGEISISRFDRYRANGQLAIFARGPHEGGFFLGEECLDFPDTARVIEILERLYGDGRSPQAQPMRFSVVWYVVTILLALAGIGAFAMRLTRQ